MSVSHEDSVPGEEPTGSASLRGRLLVAIPTLLDPNFFRSVVLVCDHDADGAVGLILNRPTDVPVAAFLPEWSDAVSAPGTVHVGGPVAGDTAIGLARVDGPIPNDGWTPVTDTIGLVDLGTPGEGVIPYLRDLRVYSGYAGWGPFQLEEEIAAAGWFVLDAAPDDAFAGGTADLWRTVLRRESGRLRLYADFPLDPSFN